MYLVPKDATRAEISCPRAGAAGKETGVNQACSRVMMQRVGGTEVCCRSRLVVSGMKRGGLRENGTAIVDGSQRSLQISAEAKRV